MILNLIREAAPSLRRVIIEAFLTTLVTVVATKSIETVFDKLFPPKVDEKSKEISEKKD